MKVNNECCEYTAPNGSICIKLIYIYIIYLTYLGYTCAGESCYSKGSEKSGDTCSHPGDNKMVERSSDSTNALAVVLYDEESVLPMHKQQRTFRYIDHDIVIQQDYTGLGVAAVVWDAAEVLCEYLEDNPTIVKGKSILELGAGTGLVGIVAALLGGIVEITDREEVLPFLEKTINKNVPPGLLKHAVPKALDWTKDLDNFQEEYDIILGADIVYIEEVFEDLLRTLQKLSNEKTILLLSCRIRYNRDTYFLSRLEEQFTMEKIVYDAVKDVNIYKAMKKRKL